LFLLLDCDRENDLLLAACKRETLFGTEQSATDGQRDIAAKSLRHITVIRGPHT